MKPAQTRVGDEGTIGPDLESTSGECWSRPTMDDGMEGVMSRAWMNEVVALRRIDVDEANGGWF